MKKEYMTTNDGEVEEQKFYGKNEEKIMIIHAYFTDGYYPWAEFFTRTLKHSNGEDNKLILSTRNLQEGKINKLQNIYKNIEVINKDLDYAQLAKRAGINESVLMAYKKETEITKVSMTNKVWKLMIAAEDRMKEVRSVHNSLPEGECFLHLDIDTYIRKPLDPLFELIRSHDFTTKFRVEKQVKRHGQIKFENKAILISVQGYTVNEKSAKFLDKWIKHLTKVKAPNRLKGFGQTSCYYAYLDMKNELSWGDISGRGFLASVGGNKNVILWGANKGPKSGTLGRYKEIFQKEGLSR
jgi:hypothetical protein